MDYLFEEHRDGSLKSESETRITFALFIYVATQRVSAVFRESDAHSSILPVFSQLRYH